LMDGIGDDACFGVVPRSGVASGAKFATR
jgi:hypothetical protein